MAKVELRESSEATSLCPPCTEEFVLSPGMLLVIDNYDSFVYNLARYFQRLGHPTEVVRNTCIDPAGVRARRPAALVFSPGPCTPDQAGVALELVRQFWQELPMLGVCLGHQILAQAFGGRIVRAPQPIHGRAALIYHTGQAVFADLPNPFQAARYHSLIVDKRSLPDCFSISAWTQDGLVMAIEHRHRPIVGFQFHPESILTECGYQLLANWLRRAGLPVQEPLPTLQQELQSP
ncbi:MAG: aminodeoxychorismate/anthranilate synthase component II [Thermoguttaceae bacterium]|nr:aminodeoxychorismate/anthranilate synthase component II [Thermoguttaceae bacterium]MDW8038383.1 aminodeoxychorismate/anthranilate synthase component II [Thermoguttaceae bacterium]